jgi:uncharacterized protein (TIGR03067 family)
VARQLKIPEGTLSSRLTTGRRLLARRLARHGLSVSAAALMTDSIATASLPARLIVDTVRAAGLTAAEQAAKGAVSAGVIVLMEGVIKMMLVQKLKTVSIVLLLIVLACCGVGLAARDATGQAETKNVAQEGHPSLALSRQSAESLQGVWALTYAVADGKKDTTTKGVFMVYGNRACVQTPEQSMTGGLYLDPTSRPRAFDFVTSETTLEGIYELHGDTLRLCTIFGSDSRRPHEFAANPGSRQVIQVFKRMKGVDLSNSRRADGSWAFPEFFERPVPYQPAPRQVPLPEAPSGSYTQTRAKPVPAPPVYKGSSARIGNILIVGNEKTPTEVIRKSLPFYPGEILNYSTLRKTEKALAEQFVPDPKRDTRPTITVVDGSGEFKDILVTFHERLAERTDRQSLEQELDYLRERTKSLEDRLAAINVGSDDFAIAEFYDKTGHPAAAAFYYQRVCQRHPGSPHAQMARERLNLSRTAPRADDKKPSIEEEMFLGGMIYDFGKAARGTRLKHSIPIKNLQAVPVQIKNVRVSAGCVTVVPTKHTLQPGETIGLDVTVDTTSFSGSKDIPVYVMFGAESDYVVLRIRATSVVKEDQEGQSSSRH